MLQQKVLIGGQWREAISEGNFSAINPATEESLPEVYPISTWADCEEALSTAADAFQAMENLSPEVIANFLDIYATAIEADKEALVDLAHAETGLPKTPRLADVELPRTTNQLRQAATAAREASWTMPTIDTAANIRSSLTAIGPVAVFGPNNFPFAFGSISGGDFAAAIAAGNPVIAKAHPSHPGTTRLFAELAQKAAKEAGLPDGAVQLLYHMSNENGLRLVSDARIAATGFTGSRHGGLALKKAADQAGKPIYLELSSVNPLVVLPGALKERGTEIADELAGSCLMGVGQFCTSPGLIILPEGHEADAFVSRVAEKLAAAPAGTLLSPVVGKSLRKAVSTLIAAGAKTVVGQQPDENDASCRSESTLLRISGTQFLEQSLLFQSEMFGNAALIVVADDVQQITAILSKLEGNLTGCVYSHTGQEDEADYTQVAHVLAQKVGRLLNDKMPTGVAVSAAMNHGGPFPSSGHPGFTAVGLPGAVRRFARLQCFDNIRPERLPSLLADTNPTGKIWRLIDGEWTRGDVK